MQGLSQGTVTGGTGEKYKREQASRQTDDRLLAHQRGIITTFPTAMS